MNKRIKQLAEQVDKEFNSPYDRYKAIERFAELIINECADVAMREDHDPAECIKRHFGIMDNIKAGADMNAGDGGYRIGTQEAYEEFVKLRTEAIALAKKEGIKERHYTNSGKPIDFPEK
jgi:hypothetical protein